MVCLFGTMWLPCILERLKLGSHPLVSSSFRDKSREYWEFCGRLFVYKGALFRCCLLRESGPPAEPPFPQLSHELSVFPSGMHTDSVYRF